MKMKKIITIYISGLLIALLSVLLTACPTEIPYSSTVKKLPTGFYVIDDSEQYFIPRDVSKIAAGSHCTVWSDNEVNLSYEQAARIAQEFDSNIFLDVTPEFAAPYDVDGDGKMAIVVYHGSSISPYTAGYFNSQDFYARSFSNLASNEMDVIYINGAPINHAPESQEFYITVAHEYQHLLNFSENVMRNGRKQMPTWMNEGMSENASAFAYTYPIYESKFNRMSSYKTSSEARDGSFSLIYWNSQIINYSVAYAFFAFLDNNYDGIFKEIYAASDSTTSIINDVLTAKGTDFNTMFTNYVHALYVKRESTPPAPGLPAFPKDFLPALFDVPKTSTNCFIYPYSFIYQSANFTDENTGLTYLDANGNIVTGQAQVQTNAVSVLWKTDSSLWSYNTISDYQNNSNETKETYASIVTRSSSSSPSSETAVSEEPIRRLDLDLNNITIKPGYEK